METRRPRLPYCLATLRDVYEICQYSEDRLSMWARAQIHTCFAPIGRVCNAGWRPSWDGCGDDVNTCTA